MNNKAIVEGLLFLSGDKGLTLGELVTHLALDPLSIENLISEMNDSYQKNEESVFMIVCTAQTYKLATKTEYVKKFETYANAVFNDVIPKSSLETLAIICYNQPITKFDIEQIKGVSPSHTVSLLLERNLIEVVGRSDEIGRPKLYAITDTALDYLGINSVDQLPELKDYSLNFNSEQSELFNSDIDFKEIRKRLLSEVEFEQKSFDLEEEEITVPSLKLYGEEENNEKIDETKGEF